MPILFSHERELHEFYSYASFINHDFQYFAQVYFHFLILFDIKSLYHLFVTRSVLVQYLFSSPLPSSLHALKFLLMIFFYIILFLFVANFSLKVRAATATPAEAAEHQADRASGAGNDCGRAGSCESAARHTKPVAALPGADGRGQAASRRNAAEKGSGFRAAAAAHCQASPRPGAAALPTTTAAAVRRPTSVREPFRPPREQRPL